MSPSRFVYSGMNARSMTVGGSVGRTVAVLAEADAVDEAEEPLKHRARGV